MLNVHTYLAQSPIAGIGLFADQHIPKGTVIWEYTPGVDLTIAKNLLVALPAPARKQIAWYGYYNIDKDAYILCSDDARFFNHADVPNCIDEQGSMHTEGRTIAARDILQGEELTCNYRTFDSDYREKLGQK